MTMRAIRSIRNKRDYEDALREASAYLTMSRSWAPPKAIVSKSSL